MKYFKQIDSLRFVAIFLVLIAHFAHPIGKHIAAGYYGVDLFFVISGFLITSILLSRNESFGKDYKKFLGRRALRIFPIYYLTVFILYFLNFKQVNDYFLFYITYTFNYAYIYLNIPMGGSSHFWSLCVEEQFYLLWPLLILSLKKKRIALYVLTIAIIAICFAQICFSIFTSQEPYNYVGVFPRAGSLCLGALGALLFKDDLLKNKYLQCKWTEFLVITILILSLAFDYPIRYFIFSLTALYLILKCVSGGFSIGIINRFLNNKKIMYLGTISYGIYIFHLPISYYLITYVFTDSFWHKFNFNKLGPFAIIQYNLWMITFFVFSLVTILIAHFSYKFIEKPILNYKDKLFKY